MSVDDIGAALPRPKRDLLPALTPLIVAAIAAPFIGSASTFVTLTAAGLAMGMMIFTMASGLTLAFGMMDVLNFGHGAFIALGAYVATLVFAAAGELGAGRFVAAQPRAVRAGARRGGRRLRLVRLRLRAAGDRAGLRPAPEADPGHHRRLDRRRAIALRLVRPRPIALAPPASFRGSFLIGDAAIEKYRVVATLVGLVVFVGLTLALNRTRIGLLIRAGVQDREMVEALGYRIDRLFIGVFMAGVGARRDRRRAVGALSQPGARLDGRRTAGAGFIVIIIGGLGSVGGCFIGAILVALIDNYAGFLAPKLALVANILLMVVVLLWRPRGLYPVSGR